jgi:uncharacterized protein (TIGR00369 family)
LSEPRVPLHDFLGLEEIERSSEGRVRIRLPYRPSWLVTESPMPMIHGGLSALLLDVAANLAVMAVTGREVSTVDLRIDYLRPAPAEKLEAEGTVLRVGKMLAVADATVVTPGGQRVAVGRGTFRVF